MEIVAIIVIALAAVFLVGAAVDVVKTARSGKKGAPVEPLRDPADCDHEWARSESGTCMPSYSSTGGPEPQETWTVERCSHCGATSFYCTGSCECYSECAAVYEG